METVLERPYKIVRTLPDGQRVLIGTVIVGRKMTPATP